MTHINDNDSNFSSKSQLTNHLKNSGIEFSFNPNPERFLSRSLTQTKIKKYLDCPACFFSKSKKDTEQSEDIMLSNTIHYVADYLIRNQTLFPNSHAVLDFINFSEGNFLEQLKTDEENTNYDILEYLVGIEDPAIKERILSGVLTIYGTSKRLGFTEVRKKDSISLNLKHTANKSQLTLYTKPDYTGRHKTIYPKSGRKYDNFLIDYKLNFSGDTKNNVLQMAFYYFTHQISRRNIHNYLVLDITSGNLYRMEGINLSHLFSILNKFLILKNLNYRGKNQDHKCNLNEDIFQENFFDNLDIENFGESFGSRTYKELLLELKLLEESLKMKDLGPIVLREELDKILSLYPIKN
jgi:hypothetical protein